MGGYLFSYHPPQHMSPCVVVGTQNTEQALPWNAPRLGEALGEPWSPRPLRWDCCQNAPGTSWDDGSTCQCVFWDSTLHARLCRECCRKPAPFSPGAQDPAGEGSRAPLMDATDDPKQQV